MQTIRISKPSQKVHLLKSFHCKLLYKYLHRCILKLRKDILEQRRGDALASTYQARNALFILFIAFALSFQNLPFSKSLFISTSLLTKPTLASSLPRIHNNPNTYKQYYITIKNIFVRFSPGIFTRYSQIWGLFHLAFPELAPVSRNIAQPVSRKTNTPSMARQQD